MSDLIETMRNRAKFFHNPDYVKAGFPGHLIEPLAAELTAAADALEAKDKRLAELEGKLDRINQWCRAYPRTVFIEPTDEQWRIANETLDAHKGDGCPSLTAISGSNMRHVVDGIQAISALKEGDGY